MKGKIRVKKSEDGRFYIVRTVKMADAQDVEPLVQRKGDDRKRHGAKVHYKEALKPLKGRSKQNQPGKVSQEETGQVINHSPPVLLVQETGFF